MITSWAIGFSVIALFLFGLVYLLAFRGFHKTVYSRAACILMLSVLATLQVYHWFAITSASTLFDQKVYLGLLFLAPSSFYLFVREMLQPQTAVSFKLLIHFVPVLLVNYITGPIAVTLAFVIGMLYGIWLCRLIYQLRSQRRYFTAELYILIGFVATALAALIVGLGAPIWGESIYIVGYANLTALFVAIILFLFLSNPGFGEKAEEAVHRSYAVSTLKGVDLDGSKKLLDQLLEDQKIYRDENLNLTGVAEQMNLSAHQLSELVNTAYGMGFSKLLRSSRIEEAKELLLDEPDTSVLSISMTVGFNSQSNFYTAFKEMTGLTPGQYRQKYSK